MSTTTVSGDSPVLSGSPIARASESLSSAGSTRPVTRTTRNAGGGTAWRATGEGAASNCRRMDMAQLFSWVSKGTEPIEEMNGELLLFIAKPSARITCESTMPLIRILAANKTTCIQAEGSDCWAASSRIASMSATPAPAAGRTVEVPSTVMSSRVPREGASRAPSTAQISTRTVWSAELSPAGREIPWHHCGSKKKNTIWECCVPSCAFVAAP